MKIPDFDNISAKDLRNDEKVKALYREAVRRKFWPNNTITALEFFSFAEKALQDDKQGTPGKLFYSLIKKKDATFIADVQEQRAQHRIPSGERYELVESAGNLNGLPAPMPEEIQNSLFGRDVGYYHGIMMQCFLPQKRLPSEMSRYTTSHGRASMVVQAGILANPDKPNTFLKCAVPFGVKARMILPYIIGHAVIRNSPEIDMGKSLRRFMESVGMPVGGRNGKLITEQVQNIAAADFILGEWEEDRTRTRKASFSKEISFWLEPGDAQQSFWTPTMVLSDDFFNVIKTRRVPVDMNHLIQLSGSPRRMDLYCWLSYRLPAIRKNTPIRIPLHYLQNIFAPDISSPRLFRQRLKADLAAIHKVYSGFSLEMAEDLLLPSKSAPPVPTKIARIL